MRSINEWNLQLQRNWPSITSDICQMCWIPLEFSALHLLCFFLPFTRLSPSAPSFLNFSVAGQILDRDKVDWRRPTDPAPLSSNKWLEICLPTRFSLHFQLPFVPPPLRVPVLNFSPQKKILRKWQVKIRAVRRPPDVIFSGRIIQTSGPLPPGVAVAAVSGHQTPSVTSD